MRRVILFPCRGETLAGTLDEASGATGLLIVSGGSEVRSGAHRGMASLAHAVAEAGHPVFRYDRRGVGDSTGDDRGFDHSRDDIAAALATFRAAAPHVTRILAFGNCDAATALGLFQPELALDGLILSNPWVVDRADDLPPAAAIRARYAARLRDPRQWLRLLTGGVNLAKLAQGLRKLSDTPAPAADPLAPRLATALGGGAAPVTLLLARDDNTALAFRDAYAGPAFAPLRARAALHQCDTASHSYARADDKAWLLARILEALR